MGITSTAKFTNANHTRRNWSNDLSISLQTHCTHCGVDFR